MLIKMKTALSQKIHIREMRAEDLERYITDLLDEHKKGIKIDYDLLNYAHTQYQQITGKYFFKTEII